MARRRRRAVSFDAMVRFFIQNYNIPTKKDIKKLTARLDQLERLLKTTETLNKHSRKSRVDAAIKRTSGD
jgi:hypothetical protein